jgi:hypothetical protein
MDGKTILSPAGCDLKQLPIGALEAFVLSLFDGHSTLEDVAEVAGLELAHATALAKRLVELGAASTKSPKKSKVPPAPDRSPRSVRPARHDPRMEKASLPPGRHDPRAETHSVRPPKVSRPPPSVGRTPSRKSLRMASVSGARAAARPTDDASDLDEATHAAIVAIAERLTTHDHYAFLELDRSAEKKAVKQAYYALASRFHPDRFFGKKLGPARTTLERVFHRLTEAHDVLTDHARRAAYDATLPPPPKARSLPPRKSSRKLSAVAAPTPPPKVPTPPPKVPTPPPKVPTSPPARATTKRPPPTARPIVPPPVTSPPTSDRAKRLSATIIDGSVRRVYQAARQVEAQKRVAVFVLAAEEALKVDDVIGAANNYRLALQNGDNPTIRAKLEEVDERAKARRFELSLTRARAAERDKKWAEAAFEFSRAHSARPGAETAERAAYAIRMSEGDLRRAIELAEYAVSKAPKNADYRLTLADLYLAANLVERAAGETDRALSLAPNDPRAKALSAAVKKRRR